MKDALNISCSVTCANKVFLLLYIWNVYAFFDFKRYICWLYDSRLTFPPLVPYRCYSTIFLLALFLTRNLPKPFYPMACNLSFMSGCFKIFLLRRLFSNLIMEYCAFLWNTVLWCLRLGLTELLKVWDYTFISEMEKDLWLFLQVLFLWSSLSGISIACFKTCTLTL